MRTTIGIIGCGNMGQAILSRVAGDFKVSVCEADKRKAATVRRKFGVRNLELARLVEDSRVIILAVKPQIFGGVALVWWKERNHSLKMFIPVLIVIALSIVTYGLWMTRGIGLPENAGLWNLAPFPLGIPVGLWLLYQGYKKSDVALAGVATFFLTPYMAVYSATSLMVIGASKYKREAVIVWVVSFVWVIYSARRLAIMFPDNVSF